MSLLLNDGSKGNLMPAPADAAGPSPSFADQEIPDLFRAAAENDLTPGEQILWVGRPSRDPRVQPKQAGVVVIGLGILCVAVLIAGSSLIFLGLKEIFPLVFAGVLGLIGCAFLLPMLVKAAPACTSCYVVTNRRTLLLQLSMVTRRPRVKSFHPHQLAGMEREDHPEVSGAGDLIFDHLFALPTTMMDEDGVPLQRRPGAGLSTSAQRVPRGFLALDNVREVEQLIRSRLLGAIEADAPPAATCDCGAAIDGRGGQLAQCQQCAALVKVPATAAEPEGYHEPDPVPADLKAKVLASLEPNERVVWLGQPEGMLVLRRSAGYFALGGLGVLISALWLLSALTQAAPKPAPAPPKQQAKGGRPPAKAAEPAPKGNPMLPVGALVVSLCIGGVPLYRWHAAKRTCYALTTRRAVVYRQGLFGPTRESYTPLEVAGLRRSDSWIYSGGGDLIFRSTTVVTTSRNSSRVTTTHYGFLALDDVAGVERLVRETLIDRFVDKLNQANAL